MQKLFALTFLTAFSISTCSAEAQTVSLDAVLKDCEQKTIVMGRAEDGKVVKVGESMSGFCKGILDGMLAVLVRTGAVCVKDKPVSTEFLLSTILTYRTETKSKDNDAANVAEAAFKRAFNCSN